MKQGKLIIMGVTVGFMLAESPETVEKLQEAYPNMQQKETHVILETYNTEEDE